MKHIVTIQTDDVEESHEIDLSPGESLITALVRAHHDGDLTLPSGWSLANVILASESDPLIEPDPDYPGRPQHLDFARMAAAAERIDELASTTSEEFSPAQAIGVDDESLRYMALNRMNSGLGALGPIALLISPESVMAASWLDGFAVGQEYQLRGGSRPAETGDAGDKEGSE
ncbi:hypothetical protein SEA_ONEIAGILLIAN_94 [Microbacterium phage OneinaGillian]|uniref:Uncharacterized protein n=1 Tax=Microbacterium phage OneinaGillian TaxID=2301604 RepID=A0A385UJE5_9CAUD|nr:hypothetical protein HOU23_gp094 [Microbacterium phage OneinaGillian]AYB70204.1 hypothetical protein SEA_ONEIAGILLIAN_94 [Microbacterium phage OneinaGillian]